MTGDAGRATDVGVLEVRTDQRRLIAALVGDIDIACSSAIETELGRELERDLDLDLVILDLSRTTYLDSSGVRMIFSLARSLVGAGHTLRLVVSDEAIVRRVVILSRLDAAVKIFSAIEDAMSLTGSPPTSTLTLPSVHSSPRAARDFVRGVLEEAGLPDASIEEAVLAANELVTNAVLHARTECSLRVDVGAGSIRIEVEDRDVTPPRREYHEREAGAGRGLVLVEQLAADWGHELLPDGKIVWCEVARSA